MWWALFVLGSLTTAIGSNFLPIADEEGSGYATALVVLACGLGATAGSGVVGGRMIRTIGERLHEAPSFSARSAGAYQAPSSGAVEVTDDKPWVRGYDWVGYGEQTVRCLSCDKDVVFPAERMRHRTHKIEIEDRAASD
jgi:hypothetical protein